ncbi:phosphoinositide-dependent kinase-1, partial [Spinellus fusiger]
PLFHHRRTVTDFHYGSVLGEGSYSTVLVGRDKRSNKFYAIKKLDKAHIVKNDKVKYVMIERDALSKMNHPGIIKLYWTFKDHRSLYFVLDLAKNGELYSYIRRLAPFDIDTARFYAAEIISALEHIHSKDVIHRDIKPENILLDERMHIKITDFGSAKIGTDATEPAKANARSFVGTAEYVSPELLCSDPVAKEADLWAFACVLFQMLSGRSPFKAPTDYLIFQNIKGLDYTFPPDFPQSACDLIQKLLVLDPTQRLGSAATGGMEAIRQHPFFNGIEWDRLFDMPAPPLKE